jgi:hypothetical protein
VIYEHGEPWWNDIDRGNLFNRSPEFSGNHISSHIAAKQEEQAKKIMNLALRSIFVHTSKWFLTCRKILRHGADGFASTPNEGVLRIFVTLKN